MSEHPEYGGQGTTRHLDQRDCGRGGQSASVARANHSGQVQLHCSEPLVVKVRESHKFVAGMRRWHSGKGGHSGSAKKGNSTIGTQRGHLSGLGTAADQDVHFDTSDP